MRQDWQSDSRGLSPVVGGALLIAIVVVLVSFTAVAILGATDETPPAPTSNFQIEEQDGGYVLKLTAGDRIDGDRITIQGIQNPELLQGQEFGAGDSVRITPTTGEVTIIWREQGTGGVSYELREFTIGPVSPIAPFPSGTVFTGTGGDILQISGDSGEVTTLYSGTAVNGLGSAGTGIPSSGEASVPFVSTDETISVLNADGSVTTVTDDTAISDSIATEKTRLAVDRFDGSGPAVFFVNQTHDTIYRATPSGSPVTVASPSNGAQSIVGAGDIDGDGSEELIFGGSSQELRYLEADGATSTTGVSSGSNNGIGTGSLADFDSDGQSEVGTVDGGNTIQFVDAGGGSTVTSSDVAGSSTPQAKKAPTAAGDVDGDFETELIYVGNDNGKLKYLDNIGKTIEIEYLTDEDGDRIDGSDETGAT
jgi:flagellin-like protein